MKLYCHSWLRKLEQLVFFEDDNKEYIKLEMSSLEMSFLWTDLRTISDY